MTAQPASAAILGSPTGSPRALFVGRTYAGHRTRFLNLRSFTASDPRIRAVYHEVSGWTEGGVIERLPLLPRALKGRARAFVQAGALATLPRPDVIWTSVAEVATPHLWAQLGGLRRPMILDLDWTYEQQEALAPMYFRRRPRSGLARRARELAERALWNSVSVFTPWSRWAADSLERNGVSADRIRVVPPGVDLELWRPRDDSRPTTGPVRLLFVGADVWRKGGDVLADIVQSRFAGRCELDIVTPETLTPRAGVRVHRATANSALLRELYRGADLFVLPTRAECFGIAAVEALASGVPVLMTAVGGAPDIVRDGENGWLIPPTAEALIAGLERALAMRSSLPGMGRRARQIAEDCFSARDNAAKVVELLLDLAARDRQPHRHTQRGNVY